MCEEESKAYAQFRTGLTFKEVYQLVWSNSEDPRNWPKTQASPRKILKGKRKGKKTAGRRHTVLGKWREIKLAMWEQEKHYTGKFIDIESFLPAPRETLVPLEEVPF